MSWTNEVIHQRTMVALPKPSQPLLVCNKRAAHHGASQNRPHCCD